MVKQFKVSVIVPVYNIEEEFLKKCIHSILNQSIKDFEIILINDGSTDNSGLICDEFKTIDERIIVIHKKNEGVSVARNTGLKIARGEWITFVDADDWLETNMLEVMYSKAEKHGGDIIISSSYVNYAHKQVRNDFLNTELYAFEGNQKVVFLYQLLCRGLNDYYPSEINVGVPWGKFYKSDFIKNKVWFFPDLKRMQDNIFNLYAFEHAKKIVYFNSPLYHYRKSTDSVYNKYSPRIVEDYEKIFNETQIFIDKYYTEDKVILSGLYSKISTSFYSYFRLYIFNDKNNSSYSRKKRDIIELTQKEPYSNALKKVDFKVLTLPEKIFVFLLQKKWILSLWALTNLEKRYHEKLNKKY